MSWSFAGASFIWLRQEVNGAVVMPRWKRQPVMSRHQFAGGEETAILRLGLGPYTISGPIWLPSNADVSALESHNGDIDTVDDGDGHTWSAVLEFDVQALSPGVDDGFTGSITLTRPTP